MAPAALQIGRAASIFFGEAGAGLFDTAPPCILSRSINAINLFQLNFIHKQLEAEYAVD